MRLIPQGCSHFRSVEPARGKETIMLKQFFAAKSMLKNIAYVILLVAIASFASGSGHAAEREISWTEDYEAAIQRAATTNSIVLLHFYGDNCPPCKLLDKKTFHDPALVSTMNEHLVTVKINANRRVDLAQKYQVTRWPTDVYLYSNGDEIYRGVSNADPAVYCKTIERVALRHRDWTVERNAMANAKEKRQDRALAARTPQSPSQHSSLAGNAGHAVRTQATSWSNSHNAPAKTAFSEQVTATKPSTSGPAPTNVRIIENPYIYQQPLIVPAALENPSSTNRAPIVRAEHAAAPQSLTPQSLTPQAPPTQAPSLQTPTPTEVVPNVASKSVVAQPVSTPRASNQAEAPSNNVSAPLGIYAETVGMEGYCPVTLIESLGKPNAIGWVLGRESCAVRHRGRVYHCATERARQLLLSDPDKYTPALSGFDIVEFCREAKLKDGKCEFGCIQQDTNRIFLFESKANYDEFLQQSKYYAGLIANAGSERVANEINGTQTR